MQVEVSPNPPEMGRQAAQHAAASIREAIERRGHAHIVVATGASQFETLKQLITAESIRWDAVSVFHLDEYVGLPVTHPASFRGYLWERFHRQLPLPVAAFHYINGEAPDPEAEARRLGELIGQVKIDVMLLGIGENGHIAFNDPPADFETEHPYLVVQLDEACRKQQYGEGWFETLEDVPAEAISMSVRQILKSDELILSIPDQRKAAAVRDALEGPVTPQVPASILQQHERATLYLDQAAASQLSAEASP